MKLPRSFNNWTSLMGAIIALVSLFIIVFLFLVSVIFDQGSSYLGLFIYIILPAFLVIGLILIPIGTFVKKKREKKKEPAHKSGWPKIDLNDKRYRNAFFIFTFGTVIFLMLSAIGSYEAYHYTESVEFCGKVCHKVMKPEYVAYQESPHARVACVDCHVGPGADWYVKSKMSGLYQVYAVTTGNYPKPIPTPVRNLRPARETCEECHWPEQFYSRKLQYRKHYIANTENTEWDISMQMKIGSNYEALGFKEGIHWHINPDVKIEYYATDRERENIPWVRYTDLKTGKSVVYQDPDTSIDISKINQSEIRVMDCMDCHNRPSHKYHPPQEFVDNAITAGRIPKDLPDIKVAAMDILNNDFPTTDSAMEYIEQEIRFYYEFLYPDIYDTNKAVIENAIAVLQEEFKKNIFPEMKVKWDVYPDHIGHLNTEGCVRCHNDKHITKGNRVISRDCNLCHEIKAQGTPGNKEYAMAEESLEFRHPVDIGEEWKTTYCAECHRDLY
ncbi:MAG: NapC/NirT family cytochrome c [Bacteroidales bacterium]|nr:NapC/NirT family cytochrome c [Bacteroidales bacterium]